MTQERNQGALVKRANLRIQGISHELKSEFDYVAMVYARKNGYDKNETRVALINRALELVNKEIRAQMGIEKEKWEAQDRYWAEKRKEMEKASAEAAPSPPNPASDHEPG